MLSVFSYARIMRARAGVRMRVYAQGSDFPGLPFVNQLLSRLVFTGGAPLLKSNPRGRRRNLL